MLKHDDGISNNSNNRPFQEVLESYQSRRQVLAGGVAGAAASFLSFSPVKALAASPASLVNFTSVPLAGAGGTSVRISNDYQYEMIIPWGDPIAPGSSETIGIGHDGMHFFPLNRLGNHGVMAINHEYGDNIVVLGKNTPTSLEEVEASQYAHGVSILEIARPSRSAMGWQTVNSRRLARRIHVNTPVEFSGPVAGSGLLDNLANNEPKGTVNNCANGYTPWGTYLTCEENFNGYFGATLGSWAASPDQARYGVTAGGFGYGWHLFDERFDLSNANYANEYRRFGWIVEIDPMDPTSKPVKRTALGRFKHEGIALVEGKDGRVVGYMGDDERFDYIYKFVSEADWKTLRSQGKSPLDHGKLYVAKFNDDGTGNWLELTISNPLLSAQFSTQAEVLTFARKAGDLLGATPMDRSEWTTVAPNGVVYATLTNNSRRTVADGANPLAPNPDGHIIRWLDADNHVGLTFSWEIFILAQSTHGTESSFSSPDGLWADPDGRLFIETDGSQHDGLNDSLLVADVLTGEVRRLLEGVHGCEVTGITTTADRRTMFINLQHPDSNTNVPRDATLAITRKDGGIVGS